VKLLAWFRLLRRQISLPKLDLIAVPGGFGAMSGGGITLSSRLLFDP
jgi:hypothetical protein